jgi:hypothetical protein
MTIKFKVTEVCDIRKEDSEVAVGNILKGEIDASGQRVFYKDRSDVEWIFYVGDTCEIVLYKHSNN